MSKGNRARYALGVIRLINGGLALFAPRTLLKMLRVDPRANGAAIYALRLFGVRTVLLGVQLLVADGDVLEQALRDGVLIHATDTMAAAATGFTKELPARSAIMTTAISSLNTVLAVTAKRAYQGSAR